MTTALAICLILGVACAVGIVLFTRGDPFAGLDFMPHVKELDTPRDKRWHERRIQAETRIPDRRVYQRRHP
jgi:hypothetical protein